MMCVCACVRTCVKGGGGGRGRGAARDHHLAQRLREHRALEGVDRLGVLLRRRRESPTSLRPRAGDGCEDRCHARKRVSLHFFNHEISLPHVLVRRTGSELRGRPTSLCSWLGTSPDEVEQHGHRNVCELCVQHARVEEMPVTRRALDLAMKQTAVLGEGRPVGEWAVDMSVDSGTGSSMR
jgi:hypothetical protein